MIGADDWRGMGFARGVISQQMRVGHTGPVFDVKQRSPQPGVIKSKIKVSSVKLRKRSVTPSSRTFLGEFSQCHMETDGRTRVSCPHGAAGWTFLPILQPLVSSSANPIGFSVATAFANGRLWWVDTRRRLCRPIYRGFWYIASTTGTSFLTGDCSRASFWDSKECIWDLSPHTFGNYSFDFVAF
jgi:hypothetical protein